MLKKGFKKIIMQAKKYEKMAGKEKCLIPVKRCKKSSGNEKT